MILVFRLVISLFILITDATQIRSDKRPNIVLLLPDQWRFDWADQYYVNNLSIHTPTFNSIVANGTRFIHACVGSPVCAPSRACIAAGKEYDYTGVPSNGHDFPEKETTIYKLMQNNGYWTMVGGKDDLTKKSTCGINGTYRLSELGFNDGRRCIGKGGGALFADYPAPSDPFTSYLNEHYNMNDGKNETEYNITYQCEEEKVCCTQNGNNGHICPVPINVHTGSYEDNWITQTTLEMMDNIPIANDKPWFIQINWAGPHPPFIILESMNKTINNRTFPYPINGTQNKNEMMIARRDYAAEIENLDNAFSIIIDKVRELGQYDNTVFCVSSDHGEMLGDYDAWQKSKPWVASSNVPLVCQGPNIKQNKIINTYVTNMDLAATLLDYTETEMIENMTSVSLRSFLNGTWNDNNNKYRKYVSSGLQNWRMVVQQINETTTWKYICCQGQCPGRTFEEKNGLVQLLFNVVDDLYEENNLADLYPNIVTDMKLLLPPNFCVPGQYTQQRSK